VCPSGLEAGSFPDGYTSIVEAAQRKANDEARKAIADSRAALPHLPEYVVSGDATGKRMIIPVHALAAGMLAHLEQSYATAHPDEEQP
jgi:hypothetical protein